MTIMTHHTGTPVAGRHVAPVTFDGPRIPADTLAFTIGDHDDPNQIRAFWVRADNGTHLEIEGGGQNPGDALMIRLDQMPMLTALLREMPNLVVNP
jgi:hypothetical protein